MRRQRRSVTRRNTMYRNSEVWNAEDFLKLEDGDLQKYIYTNHTISISDIFTKVDDEGKIGYFQIGRSLRINNSGKFYVKSKTSQYIVYDKKTKKVRLSAANNLVYPIMLKDYLDVQSWMGKWMPKATSTFCKKVMEGKIVMMEDVIKYHRSYTIKKKDIPLDVIYKFMIYNDRHLLQLVEDPENAGNEPIISLPLNYLHIKPFKFKIENAGRVEERFAEWNRAQSKKYDIVKRQRNAAHGSDIEQEAFDETSNLLAELPQF